MSTRVKGILLLFAVLVAAASADAPTPSPTLSGCQVCADTKDCSRAYLDAPGQFCGNWLDQLNQKQRCCCPPKTEAKCKLSNYSCRCSPVSKTSSNVSSTGWIGVALGIAVVLGCCISCGWCCYRSRRHAHYGEQLPPVAHPVAIYAPPVQPGCVAPPVPVQVPGYPGYAQPMPMYMAPTAPVYDYSYGGYGRGSYGYSSGGFSSGVATVAGLAAGMMLVDAVADAGHHHHHGYGGGYGDGFDSVGGFDGGGGDFGGDF